MNGFAKIASGLAVLGLGLGVGTAQAQTSGSAGIDQLSTPAARADGRPVSAAPAGGPAPLQPATAVRDSGAVGQVGSNAAVGLPTPQLSASEAGRRVAGAPRSAESARPAAQLSRTDPTARAPSVPAATVDACEAILTGRRAPIAGLDCEAVMEAVAAAAPVQRSAETALLADPTLEEARRTGALRPTGNASPNADDIARRLATGDVQNSPIAQAVGSGFTGTGPPAPPTTNVVVNPVTPNAPPVTINPGGR